MRDDAETAVRPRASAYGLFDVGDRVGNKRVSEQMPCRCILLRRPLTCLGAGSGAPAKVGLVEIIAKGIQL
jgi:hypothetical protein